MKVVEHLPQTLRLEKRRPAGIRRALRDWVVSAVWSHDHVALLAPPRALLVVGDVHGAHRRLHSLRDSADGRASASGAAARAARGLSDRPSRPRGRRACTRPRRGREAHLPQEATALLLRHDAAEDDEAVALEGLALVWLQRHRRRHRHLVRLAAVPPAARSHDGGGLGWRRLARRRRWGRHWVERGWGGGGTRRGLDGAVACGGDGRAARPSAARAPPPLAGAVNRCCEEPMGPLPPRPALPVRSRAEHEQGEMRAAGETARAGTRATAPGHGPCPMAAEAPPHVWHAGSSRVARLALGGSVGCSVAGRSASRGSLRGLGWAFSLHEPAEPGVGRGVDIDARCGGRSGSGCTYWTATPEV